MQGTHLARLTVYRPSTEASAVIFFSFFFSFPPHAAIASDTFGGTDLSLHIGLQSAGNRSIAQVGSCLLKIINMKRTEGYVSAHFSYNYMLI